MRFQIFHLVPHSSHNIKTLQIVTTRWHLMKHFGPLISDIAMILQINPNFFFNVGPN